MNNPPRDYERIAIYLIEMYAGKVMLFDELFKLFETKNKSGIEGALSRAEPKLAAKGYRVENERGKGYWILGIDQDKPLNII